MAVATVCSQHYNAAKNPPLGSCAASPCDPTSIDQVTGNACRPCQAPCKFIQGNGTWSHPVCMAVYYPQCPKVNVLGLCNANAGAYLPSITVCAQRLWSF